VLSQFFDSRDNLVTGFVSRGVKEDKNIMLGVLNN
jgi:hypothetical protein